jgi:tetratricopeptide (TPR) repeat protein
MGYSHSLGSAGTLGIGWTNFSVNACYSEDTFIFTYAGEFPNPFKKGALTAGLNLKLLSVKVESTSDTQENPVFDNGRSKTGNSLDLGFLYCLSISHRAALTFYNINRPDMGFSSEDKIASNMKLGYAYKGDEFNIALDFVFNRGDFVTSTGIEKWSRNKNFGIRGGLSSASRGYTNFSLGASCKYKENLQFDYSFICPLKGISSIYTSHRTSLTFRFGTGFQEKLKIESNLREIKTQLEEAKGEFLKVSSHIDEVMKLAEQKKKAAAEAEDRRRRAKKRVELFEEKLRKTTKKLINKYWKSGLDYYNRKKYEKTIVEFNKILELDSTHDKSKQFIKLANTQLLKEKLENVEKYYTRGLKAYSEGNLGAAVRNWNKALEFDPENKKIRTALEGAKKEIKLEKNGRATDDH